MRWTKKTPTKPGYYWAIPTLGSNWGQTTCLVKVEPHFSKSGLVAWLFGNECEQPLSRFAKWGRRIPEPR